MRTFIAPENTMKSLSLARRVAPFLYAAALVMAGDSPAAVRPGQADNTFGESGNGLQIFALGPLSTILATTATAAGDIYAVGRHETNPIALKFQPNGLPDVDFGVVEYETPADHKADFSEVQASVDGSIVAGGKLENDAGTFGLVCKIIPSGKLDSEFAGDSIMPGCRLLDNLSEVFSVAVLSDSSILASGYKQTGNTGYVLAIVKVSDKGLVDTAFADGDGVASLPESYTSVSGALKSEVSEDGLITTLATVGNAPTLVRHLPDGSLDHTFDEDGVLIAAPFGLVLGMVVNPDQSVVLGLLPDAVDFREITFMKFAPDGTPSQDYNNPYYPPGVSRVSICNTSCDLIVPSRPSSLLRLEDGRLVLGLSQYFDEIDAMRTLSLRIVGTGEADPSFGDNISQLPVGVGQSVAIPGFMPSTSSALRGDKLTVMGKISEENSLRLIITGFTGDRLFSDGFD